MAFIAKKERNFIKYLKNHFDLELPSGIDIFYAKGIRVGTSILPRSQIHGELGYAASDFGFNPTNALIQNFGHLAKKNRVDLAEPEAKLFAGGASLPMDLGKSAKFIIVRYDGHTLGLGRYEPLRKLLVSRIPEKRRRRINNSLRK